VIRSIHDKHHIGCDHAKLANLQFITDKVEVVLHVLLEILHMFKVIIIGIVTDNNIGVVDDVLQKTQLVVVFERKGLVRIGYRGH